MESTGKYLRMFETLRLGLARANRELLRAALDVVEQEVSDAEARQYGSFTPPPVRPVAATSPGKPGLPVRSPTERFRGVPPIRDATTHPKGEE